VTKKPLLLGHRGCRSRVHPAFPVENSLAAFEYALAHGCDGFEFDVRHTRDGRNVLWHDPVWKGQEIASTPQRGFMLSTFYPDILARLNDLDGSLPLGFLCERDQAMAVWHQMPIQVLLPHDCYVQPTLIDEAHTRGLQIMTWTVNDAGRMLKLGEWGIDGIISDDPGLLYQTFHSE